MALWVKSSSQPISLATSGFPQTADMAMALVVFSSGPESEVAGLPHRERLKIGEPNVI